MSADAALERRLQRVRRIIVVLSGKGGVGKSSVAAQLALTLSYEAASSEPDASRLRVGLLDLDLTGPSIPRMLGLDGPVSYTHLTLPTKRIV